MGLAMDAVTSGTMGVPAVWSRRTWSTVSSDHSTWGGGFSTRGQRTGVAAAGDGEAGGVVREPATVDAAEIRVAHMGDGGDHSRHVDAVGVAASWKAHVAAIGPPEP